MLIVTFLEQLPCLIRHLNYFQSIIFWCSTVILYRPDLIDFDKLKKSNAHYNLQNAFNLAEQHLGLTKLLDPEGKDPRCKRLNKVILCWGALCLQQALKYQSKRSFKIPVVTWGFVGWVTSNRFEKWVRERGMGKAEDPERKASLMIEGLYGNGVKNTHGLNSAG